MSIEKRNSKTSETKARNKLLGWLVSYEATEKGSYYELREGRCFIGKGIVAGEKLISPNQALGTAQSLLISKIDDESSNTLLKGKVVVQDLFSDAGTFVARSAGGEEIQIEGPCELEHGDWVRFGTESKFQVCLVNGLK